MKKTISITIDYNKYGLPIIENQIGDEISFLEYSSKQLIIRGNKGGLLLMAKALIALSLMDQPNGYHIHLDDLYELNDNQQEIIIENIDLK